MRNGMENIHVYAGVLQVLGSKSALTIVKLKKRPIPPTAFFNVSKPLSLK